MNYPCDPSKRVLIRKADFKDGTGPSWHIIAGTVFIRCDCGKILGSPTKHSIQADGQIDASIVCDSCKFHVFGILQDWTYGTMAAGQLKDV